MNYTIICISLVVTVVMLSIFSWAFGHLYVFFEDCLFRSSAYFSIGLSAVSFADILSHSVGYLFILFMVSFAVQKLLSLIRSHVFIFPFIFITLEGESKMYAVAIYVRAFCLHFPLNIYSVWPYIYIFDPFWVYFCLWCWRMF